MVRYAAKLSPADQVCPWTHTPVLHCFRNDDPEKAYQAMQEGVRRMVRRVPYLAGYIARGDQGYTHLHWDDNVTGDELKLEWKDARLKSDVPTYGELADKGLQIQDVSFDFKPTGCLTRELTPKDKEPALLLSFTALRGGFIASIAPMHHLCDGMGNVALFVTWAQCTAGDPLTFPLDPKEPLKRYDTFLQSTGLQPSANHKQAVTIKDNTDESSPTELERVPAPMPLGDRTTLLSRKMFVVSSESIEELRQAVSKDTGKRPPFTISVLAALFWVLITDIRHKRGAAAERKKEDEEEPSTSLMTVADARVAFPKLGPYSMANFLSPAFTSASCADLASAKSTDAKPPSAPYPPALPQAAALVSEGLRNALNPAFIMPKLQAITNIPDARLLALAGGNPMGANDILMTSWAGFHHYNSYGDVCGSPECHRAQPTDNKTQRSTFSYIVVLPRRKGGDGKDINEVFACFEEADMKELEKHPLLSHWLYKAPPFATPKPRARL